MGWRRRRCKPKLLAEQNAAAMNAPLTCTLQVLGVLYPKLPGSKAGKALAHFKEAAARQESNAELWEVLGDVLAAVDPAGLVVGWGGMAEEALGDGLAAFEIAYLRAWCVCLARPWVDGVSMLGR